MRFFQSESQISLIVGFVIVRVIRFDLGLCNTIIPLKEEAAIFQRIHVVINEIC